MKRLVKISGVMLVLVLAYGLNASGQRGYGPPMRGNGMQGPGRGYGMRTMADSTGKPDTLVFRRMPQAGIYGPRFGQMPRHFQGNAWGMPNAGRRGMGPGDPFGPGRGLGPMERNRNRGNDQGLGRIDLLPGLSEKQKKDIEAVRKSQFSEMEKLRSDMQSKMQAMREEHRKKLLDLLTEEQKSLLGGFKQVKDSNVPK